MKKRIIAIICTLALLIPMAALPTSALASWVTYAPPSDIDYSFAVFGDMQSITWTDNKKGTQYVKSAFDWILNNKNSRKIEYVFGLGDSVDTLTTYSTNVVQSNGKTQNVNEWIVVSDQFHRLDGVIPYTVVRGNHDDEGGYHKYICTEDYKAQMDGFFYDPSKPATLGNSMSNCFRKIEIGGTKYLMLAIDYNADDAVMAWANEVISSNPDYRVIASVHAYINGGYSGGVGALDGSSDPDYFYKDNIGAANPDNTQQINTPFNGRALWEGIFAKHENMFMVLCGHDAIPTPVHYERIGNNGNTVIEILTDTSKYDVEKSTNYGGNLMMLLNFREDTNELQIEYLSPSRSQAGYSDYHLAGEQLSFTYKDVADWKNVTRDLGLHVYVGAPMTAPPTLDGVVTTREYSYSKYYAPEELIGHNTSIVQGGVNEYIAHDADYIYYAVSMTQETDDLGLQWQFNPFNSFGIFNDKTNLKNTLFQRIMWQIRYQSDGTTTLLGNSIAWNYAMSEDLPAVGTDIQYKATKTAENLKTYEIKLSKAYLAEYNKCDKEDIKVLPYMTHQHSTSSIAHTYTQQDVNTLSSYGATRADLGTAPIFMVLEEDPDSIQNKITPNTQETASTKISIEDPTLRFKTNFVKSDLDELVGKFGAENVSVGTLIAPADTLGTASLTHKIGSPNVDYIDVKADVSQPLSEQNGTLTYVGTISGISQSDLGKDFTAVGYVAYRVNERCDWVYIYSKSSATRSVDFVATAAINDTTRTYAPEAYLILERLTVAYHQNRASSLG